MGKDIIDQHTRTVVFSALTIVGVIGVGVMCLLPKPGSEGGGRTDDLGGPFNALKKSFALFKTRDMLLLSATFFYTGMYSISRFVFCKIFVSFHYIPKLNSCQ